METTGAGEWVCGTKNLDALISYLDKLRTKKLNKDQDLEEAPNQNIFL